MANRWTTAGATNHPTVPTTGADAEDEGQHGRQTSSWWRRGSSEPAYTAVVPVQGADQATVEVAEDRLHGADQGDQTPAVHPQVVDEVRGHHHVQRGPGRVGRGCSTPSLRNRTAGRRPAVGGRGPSHDLMTAPEGSRTPAHALQHFEDRWHVGVGVVVRHETRAGPRCRGAGGDPRISASARGADLRPTGSPRPGAGSPFPSPSSTISGTAPTDVATNGEAGGHGLEDGPAVGVAFGGQYEHTSASR